MNVLMVNHPECERFRGGDLVQMRQTAAALKPLGVRVAESFALEPDASGFDLAHVFNLRTVLATPRQVAHLKAQGVPVVLSPIYLNPTIAVWGGRAVAGAFQDNPAPELLAARLRSIRERTMTVHQTDGPALTARGEYRPHPDYDRLQRRALADADLLLVNSILELHALTRSLDIAVPRFAVAPVGVDPAAFLNADPAPFVAKFGLSDFVLQVGRIEGTKNQLMLAHALRDAGLKLVLIGGNRQPQYLESVRRHGSADLLVIDHLPQSEVASAYAAARVHVLPSWSETCGLVNLEAAVAGCAVVAGSLGYEVEYLREYADYCDPANAESIRETVWSAWTDHPRGAIRRELLRRRVLENFTWATAAEATLAAYRSVLS